MKPSEWGSGLRSMVDMPIPAGVWPVLAWALTPGERVSESLKIAASEYRNQTGIHAQFAYVSTMPSGAPEFVEVGELTVMTANWVPRGYAVVCAGNTQIIDEEYRKWQRVS